MCKCKRHAHYRVWDCGGGGLVIDCGTAVAMYFMLNVSDPVFCNLAQNSESQLLLKVFIHVTESFLVFIKQVPESMYILVTWD